MGKIGVPGVTRTRDPQFRKLLLYPAELRGLRKRRYSGGAVCASGLVRRSSDDGAGGFGYRFGSATAAVGLP